MIISGQRNQSSCVPATPHCSQFNILSFAVLAHYTQYFPIVTCPAVLLNQFQEEDFQIQLFEFIILFPAPLDLMTFPGRADHSYV